MRNSRTLVGLGGLGLLALYGLGQQAPDTPPASPPMFAALPPAADDVVPVAAAPAPAEEKVRWRASEVMVRIAPDGDLDDVAQRHQLVVLREAGPSGYALLSIPATEDPLEASRALLADPDVLRSAPNGVVYGAGNGKKSKQKSGESTPRDWQWHLDEVGTLDTDVSGITVAILDSGVSHELTESLADVSVVAPYDFVDRDDDPADEHWHGTHIASLIASDGGVVGLAPGVTLMPVRVLDENNAGTELDLLDGIYHAVDNGADIVNMSLAFAPSYVPSRALVEALEAAHDAGIVMVAAAGNGGEVIVCWPAASPWVIAVGAHTLSDLPAEYTNHGPLLDVSAPGGTMGEDSDEDGYPDGLLAETINPSDPTEAGYFFAAGSSQAAALVSAVAAHLLAEDVPPAQVATALQGNGSSWAVSTDNLYGRGQLALKNSSSKRGGGYSSSFYADRDYHVMVMPWLAESTDGTQVQARARVTLFDGDGNLQRQDQTIYGVLSSVEGAELVSCNLEFWQDPHCDLAGPWVDRLDENGELMPQLWSFQVQAVEEWGMGLSWRPRAAITGGDGLELLLAALDSEGLASAPLGIYWERTEHDVLGPIAESYALTNSGAGFASSPLGTLFNAAAFPGDLTTTSVDVDLDGTGLTSSPLGTLALQRMTLSTTLGGTGLVSSPLGSLSFQAYTLRGVADSSDPLGLDAFSLLAGESDGLDGELLGESVPVWLDEGGSPTADLSGTAVQAVLDEGGWVTEDGLEPVQIIQAGSLAPEGASSEVGEPEALTD